MARICAWRAKARASSFDPAVSAPPTIRRIQPGPAWPLHDVAATRTLEKLALAQAPTHGLMQRAGTAVARLCLAIAPHAQSIWVAAGPGNNGGDGLQAAAMLQTQGKDVTVTWLGSLETASADSKAAHRHAIANGVRFAQAPPGQFDLCVDALLGLGAARAPEGTMTQWIDLINRSGKPVVSIDLPTGLNADTGQAAGPCVIADACLCLLTLKPGLFTASGRDASASVWLDDLQVDWSAPAFANAPEACAILAGEPAPRRLRHATHKGSNGDVVVVGGAAGMAGAATLAALAALYQGAGRVYLAALDPRSGAMTSGHPEIMVRDVERLDYSTATVVCGCGGGDEVAQHLPRILATASSLVLDADALNAIARDSGLQRQLRARQSRGWRTVLTPHPLETARLLDSDTVAVQADRLRAATALAQRTASTVLLKGSGTVVAEALQTTRIMPVGNARLASAGTGDVLAGAIGCALANGLSAFQAAGDMAFLHARCADRWPLDQPLTASGLATANWH